LSERDTILPIVPMFHANCWGIPFACALVGAGLVLPGCSLDALSLTDLLAGERVTFAGRHVAVHDAVLLPAPERAPRLMIGSNGPRMLGIALPHVDAWNTWYEHYGNTPEGFAALDARVTAAAREAGRDPGQIERSACVFVALEHGAGTRPVTPGVPPLRGRPERLAEALRELAQAGADEAILVADPIDERSIRALGEVIALLR
jgi:alkanesulfonate monooxygenase SsuD/methylene tetrahydromethanopterin reductase-like flavin-dependent oxidoreductase (luciferase family)